MMRKNNEPVWFDGPERELELLNLTAADKKKFFRKGDGWKDCEPKNFQVVEGEIVKAMRRINASRS